MLYWLHNLVENYWDFFLVLSGSGLVLHRGFLEFQAGLWIWHYYNVTNLYHECCGYRCYIDRGTIIILYIGVHLNYRPPVLFQYIFYIPTVQYDSSIGLVYTQMISISSVWYVIRTIVRDHRFYLECILSQCNIKCSRPCSYFYTTRSHDIL